MQPDEKGTRKDLVLYRIETAKSDYDDFYIATREEAEEQILTARELINQVEEYVNIRWKADRSNV